MPSGRDEILASVAGQVPAAFFQFRRGGPQHEHFPFASDRIVDLTELTPTALREESAPFWALLSPDDTTRVRRSLERSAQRLTPWEVEFQVRLPSGHLRWLAIIAAPRREADGGTLWHGMVFDATERRRAQQAEKMAAIGRLAGGVAHDLNNLLTAIGSNADLALAELATDHPARRFLERSHQAAERAADLTRHLLAFGQRQVLRLDRIHWNEIVAQAFEGDRLLATDQPALTLELRLDDETPPVLADRERLEQVLANLVANAAEAMPSGGQITIATGRREFDVSEAGRWPGMRAGDYAWLAVQDTGVGFDDGMQLHLFEPFFTTKALDGRSGGLGLSTVYGIVKQLEGYIYAESLPGVGTTFTVYLPVAVETAVSEPMPERRHAPRRNGIVLVAEDEDGVREPVRRVLERFGYRVIDVSNGSAALTAAAESSEPIDLLLTDIVMPGMSGSELAKQLQELRPGVRVLFMSGYSSEAIATHGMLAPGSSFLQKPFSVTELVERVRETLGHATL
jgi:PAS domain S-box-containing protein